MKRFFLVTFVLFSFVFSNSVSASSEIKIGIIDTYSGPATTFTQDVLDGFKLALDTINKRGVLGRKIVFVTRDDKFKPDIALSMAKELVLKENVDILMGTISSASALAISDFCAKEKIPFFVTFAKSDKITGEKGHRYVFNMNENTEMAGRAAAKVLAKKKYTKYWIAGDDYEYGHAIANSVFNHLKELNKKVEKVGESWWKVGETDFTPYITQILSAKPDFVIVATGGAGMVNFQKAAKATGLYKKIPFYQHTGIELSTLMPQGLNAPQGVYGTANYLFYYPETKENKKFVEEFRKNYNRYPKSGAFYGYMTAHFIAKAFEKAGKVDKESFISAMEGLALDSPIGKVEVRACDHQIMLPIFFGMTDKSPKYDFLVAKDIIAVQPESYMPTCKEVLSKRK